MPEKQQEQEYLQIDLGKTTPVYGLEIQGSTVRQSYISSFSILYSDDGIIYSSIQENNQQTKVN